MKANNRINVRWMALPEGRLRGLQASRVRLDLHSCPAVPSTEREECARHPANRGPTADSWLMSRSGNQLVKVTLTFNYQEWSISNFPCSLTGNITPYSMENLAFYSLLRWKTIILTILTTLLIYFSLKVWENVLFELGSERVNPLGKITWARSLAVRLASGQCTERRGIIRQF